MKILVTGGAGFIGSHLSERLLAERHEVICLDNFNDFYDPLIKRNNIKSLLSKRKFNLVEVDVRNQASLDKIFRSFKIHRVIHLAAQSGVRLSLDNPGLYFDINVMGTLNILELCKKYQIKGLIYGSSSSVYGRAKNVPWSEENKTIPISPYGVSKKTAELLCGNYHYLYHLPITILRFFTVYGPRQRPDMAIYKFTKKINEGREIALYGRGKIKRDFTYVSDIVDGIVSALNKNFNYKILNLGNSRPITLLHLISIIKKNLGKKAKIKLLPQLPEDPPITYAKITRSKKFLNYHPRVSIEVGINNFIQWYSHEKT